MTLPQSPMLSPRSYLTGETPMLLPLRGDPPMLSPNVARGRVKRHSPESIMVCDPGQDQKHERNSFQVEAILLLADIGTHPSERILPVDVPPFTSDGLALEVSNLEEDDERDDDWATADDGASLEEDSDNVRDEDWATADDEVVIEESSEHTQGGAIDALAAVALKLQFEDRIRVREREEAHMRLGNLSAMLVSSPGIQERLVPGMPGVSTFAPTAAPPPPQPWPTRSTFRSTHAERAWTEHASERAYERAHARNNLLVKKAGDWRGTQFSSTISTMRGMTTHGGLPTRVATTGGGRPIRVPQRAFRDKVSPYRSPSLHSMHQLDVIAACQAPCYLYANSSIMSLTLAHLGVSHQPTTVVYRYPSPQPSTTLTSQARTQHPSLVPAPVPAPCTTPNKASRSCTRHIRHI